MNKEFCNQLRNGESLVGIFVKLNDPAVVELVSQFELDFIVIDAEHAPLDRDQINLLLLAAKASNLPAILRVPEGTKNWFSTGLDSGAAGIMVPHVSNKEEASRLADLMKFGKNGRGFSPSTRAAKFGFRGIAEHHSSQPDETALICQIEDEDGVQNSSDIASVAGVDCLFVGPVDLAVSIGVTNLKSKKLKKLCKEVIGNSIAWQKAAGIFISSKSELVGWRKNGSSLNIIGTDQALLQFGLREVLA